MSLTDVLIELLDELSARGSPIVGQLRPGLSRASLVARLKYPLTPCDDLVEWFAFADGVWVPPEALGGQAELFPGYVPMSLEEALMARERELAFAGRLLLEAVSKGEEPFITFALDCLPILHGQPVVSMGTGDERRGLTEGRVCAAQHAEQFEQQDPDLMTWVRRTLAQLRSGDLIVDPWGAIHHAQFLPPNYRRETALNFQFWPGSLEYTLSTGSRPKGQALAHFAGIIERCGRVRVEGYPKDFVPNNAGLEPYQIQEVVRLLRMFGVPADQITTMAVEPPTRWHAHKVSARVPIPLPPRPTRGS